MRINRTGRGRDPFEVTLSDQTRQDLVLDLCRAIDDALAARSATDADIEYWHQLYEQQRTRGSGPWPEAADLTSFLGTHYVDVMRSDIVRSVMDEPIWTVAGYGESAQKAPFVEEFHQWQAEISGFQGAFARAVHLALIEPMGILEVYRETYRRPVRKKIWAELELGPDGRALMDANMKPVLKQKPEDGTFIEAIDEQTPAAEVEIDSYELVNQGPRERVIAYRDFLRFPGHASDKAEVWGYAKRFYRAIDDLEDRAEQGIYDTAAIKDLGTDDERASQTTLAGEAVGVMAKDGTEKVEKELWELTVLKNLDGKGLRWYTLTLHKDKQVLLRLQYDDIGKPRYFCLVPFPRPNSLEGYSYIGHKLITVIEEHTAWRNMTADDAAMQLQLPMWRRTGALWDPESQPIGPRAVLDVRDPQELGFFERQPNSTVGAERIRDAERGAERLAGINDAAAGVTSDEKRTLGEIELVTMQSKGRTAEAVKNIQETLEDLAQVRHLMLVQMLKEKGRDGVVAPASVQERMQTRLQRWPEFLAPPEQVMGLEARQPEVVTTNAPQPLAFTEAMMTGTFRFKPRGSVESADRAHQRYDWNQFLLALGSLAKVNPMIQQIMQTPQAAKALMEMALRLYNVSDKQPFIGSEALDAAQRQWQAIAQQTMRAGAPNPDVAAQVAAGPSAPQTGAMS